MPRKKKGDEAVADTLSKLELEIGRIKSAVGVDVGAISGIDNLALEDGINQSCNGICGNVEKLLKTSETDIKKAAIAAARYNVEQLNAVKNLELSAEMLESCNQGCNGIC